MQLFSYWSGPVTWLEKLSVASAAASGHDVTVFTYDDTAKLAHDLGCRALAADVILDDGSLDDLRRTIPSHFSDHFRLEGIAAGHGAWFDLDIVFLKPLPDDPYVFGWQKANRIGNSLLRFPANDECLRHYLEFCRRRPMARYVMPWYPWTRKVTRSIKAAVSPLTGVASPAPKYGPDALTHFVKAGQLAHWARPRHVYYPVPIEAGVISQIDQPGFLERLIAPETVCVHVWRTTYFGRRGSGQPKSGWLAEQAFAFSR